MAADMRRREFIGLVGGAAAAWPLAVRSQQPAKLPTIGFLGVSTSAAWTPWTIAFVRRLGELGWTDGRNLAIEYRWAEGHSERFAEFAAEFVARKVDIIVTSGSAAPAAMKATSTIPIVFALVVDPIAAGLVTSLARPGGNATGLSGQSNETASKRLEILRDYEQTTCCHVADDVPIIDGVDYRGRLRRKAGPGASAIPRER